MTLFPLNITHMLPLCPSYRLYGSTSILVRLRRSDVDVIIEGKRSHQFRLLNVIYQPIP